MKKLKDGTFFVEVGETFTTEDGTTLRCEESDHCTGCYFHAVLETGRTTCVQHRTALLMCGGAHREDGKYVSFVRV